MAPDRLAGGEDAPELEHGVDDEDPARVHVERRPLEQDLLPRDGDRKLGVDGDGRVADAVEDGRPILGVARALGDTFEAHRDEPAQVRDARVALELGDDGLDPGDLVRERVELVHGAVEEPVALEEPPAARLIHVVEALRVRPERDLECLRGLARELRSLAIDHDEERVLEVRKVLRERGVVRRDGMSGETSARLSEFTPRFSAA